LVVRRKIAGGVAADQGDGENKRVARVHSAALTDQTRSDRPAWTGSQL
jgi:hypothetical protein